VVDRSNPHIDNNTELDFVGATQKAKKYSSGAREKQRRYL
jgi:hypothetical protein